MMKRIKSKKKKVLIIALCIAAALLIAGDWFLSVAIYNENFDQRFESYEPMMWYVDDFDGLLNLPIYENPPEMAGFFYFVKEDMKHGTKKVYVPVGTHQRQP